MTITYRYKQIYIDVQYVEFCSEVTTKSTNIRQHVNMICNSLVHVFAPWISYAESTPIGRYVYRLILLLVLLLNKRKHICKCMEEAEAHAICNTG